MTHAETALQRSHLIVAKVDALYRMIDASDGDFRIVANGLAALLNVRLDPSDYTGLQACIDLIVSLHENRSSR